LHESRSRSFECRAKKDQLWPCFEQTQVSCKEIPNWAFIGVERWALSRPICANQKLLTMPNNRLKIRKNKCPVLILSGNPIDEKYHDIQKYLILTLPTVVVAPIVGFIFDLYLPDSAVRLKKKQ